MLAIFAALDFLRYLKEIKDHEVIIDQDVNNFFDYIRKKFFLKYYIFFSESTY